MCAAAALWSKRLKAASSSQAFALDSWLDVRAVAGLESRRGYAGQGAAVIQEVRRRAFQEVRRPMFHG